MDASIALNRFGLGAAPDDRIEGSPRRWLLDQLERYSPRPPGIAALAPSTTIAAELADYLKQSRMERRMPAVAPDPTMRNAAPATGAPIRKRGADARREARREGRDHYVAAVQARAQVAIDTPAPFAERLVHFWANHFAVSADKLTTVGLAGAMEFEAIRPHLLGSFREMLHAVERHPAMLLYLDQAQSVGPGSPAGLATGNRARKLGLNENLAREILELHTLGVRTGYRQSDVTEFARAMTGWTVAGLGRGGSGRGRPVGSFAFVPRLHEPGARTVLGRSWNQPGEAQAAAVLDMLATHPATARHIATKLARHFGGDDPPAPLVARLEKAFLASDGDLPSVYRALVEAPECW
ncbi:MAG TPA: DUF1800 domain-containing protein, partial [Sphingomonas sp.]|nr:DUF1800 domain-containing protein [Sphingomonas sp.]